MFIIFCFYQLKVYRDPFVTTHWFEDRRNDDIILTDDRLDDSRFDKICV